MSEAIGGLVAKWRHSARKAHGGAYAFNECADELERSPELAEAIESRAKYLWILANPSKAKELIEFAWDLDAAVSKAMNPD